MEYGPERLINELLTYKRAPAELTAGFRSKRHNAELVPLFRSRAEEVLDAFRKYRDIVYETQGLGDEGTDVLIRFGTERSGPVICLQLKSEDDVQKPKVSNDLILQWQRSEDRFRDRILDYYIILCCDAQRNVEVIRRIQAVMSTKPVIVIVPEFAWTFISLSATAIDGLARVKMSSEDVVVKAALELVADLPPSETALLLLLVHEAILGAGGPISQANLAQSTFLRSVYDRVGPLGRDQYLYAGPRGLDEYDNHKSADAEEQELALDFESQLARDLDQVSDAFVSELEGENYGVDLTTVQPLVWLLVDGSVRYEYQDSELLEFALSALKTSDVAEGTPPAQE